jgi:hypothetical protein
VNLPPNGGTGSATLKDPDGHTLFFDTSAEELLERKASS